MQFKDGFDLCAKRAQNVNNISCLCDIVGKLLRKRQSTFDFYLLDFYGCKIWKTNLPQKLVGNCALGTESHQSPFI